MSDEHNDMVASAIRARGNELYKKSNFLAAIKLYEKAIEKADSDDALPHANLSAALFEIGDYSNCIIAASTALQRDNHREQSWKAKLTLRIANAEMHLFARHQSTTSHLVTQTSEEMTTTRTNLERIYRQQNKDEAWSKIIQEVPPIKPYLLVFVQARSSMNR